MSIDRRQADQGARDFATLLLAPTLMLAGFTSALELYDWLNRRLTSYDLCRLTRHDFAPMSLFEKIRGRGPSPGPAPASRRSAA